MVAQDTGADYEKVPESLKEAPHWMCWKNEEGRKVPKLASTRGVFYGSSTDTSRHRTFEEAIAALRTGNFDGPARAIMEDEEYVGVDLDHCIEDGEILPWAQEIINDLDTYTEISPSGTGVKMWLRAKDLKRSYEKKAEKEIEIYPHGRFFTVTGQSINGRHVNDRQAELDALIAREWPRKKVKFDKSAGRIGWDLAEWLEKQDVEIRGEVFDRESTVKFEIDCPWSKEHTDSNTVAYVGQYESGATWFNCYHAHCEGRKWREFREKVSSTTNNANTTNTANNANTTNSEIFTAAALLAEELPPVRWVVPDLLPEGVTLLPGKPKKGKSWMALGMCVAVATGGYVFGSIQVDEGDTLYLSLEDNKRRLQKRLKKLLRGDGPPEKLHMVLTWPRLHEGGDAKLDDWLDEHPDTKLVVIDTLQKVRKPAKGNAVYQEDYAALESLLPIAAKHQVAILVVYHLRKTPGVDPEDEISSSTGLTGGVDGWLILRNAPGKGVTLHINGRDIEEPKEYAMHFDPMAATWTIRGDADEVQMSEERAKILKVLRFAGESLGPKEIADLIPGAKPGNIRYLLYKMVEDVQVIKDSRGKYSPVVSDEESTTNTTANNENRSNPHKTVDDPPNVSDVSDVSDGVKEKVHKEDKKAKEHNEAAARWAEEALAIFHEFGDAIHNGGVSRETWEELCRRRGLQSQHFKRALYYLEKYGRVEYIMADHHEDSRYVLAQELQV